MAEIVNVIVAFAVIIFIFRWATSASDADRAAVDALGFRPKSVTQDMLDTISNMFPDIPLDNIRYDLLRTGSVELTTNKILERGYLDPPPATYFQLYPRTPAPTRSAATGTSTAVKAKPKENLIERFHLQGRIEESAEPIPDSEVGGKSVWEDTPEKREANLRERKAKMILAARQRMLSAQQKGAESGTLTSN